MSTLFPLFYHKFLTNAIGYGYKIGISEKNVILLRYKAKNGGICQKSRRLTALLPEDLSVTGFDNAALAARNGITTVSQDFGEMAKMALNMIFYQLANPALINNCSGVSHIRSVLWERWSTAPAKEPEAR